MKIAISSTKDPKINGVKEMVNSCPYFRDILNSIEYDAI
jgi:hypothetical protein